MKRRNLLKTIPALPLVASRVMADANVGDWGPAATAAPYLDGNFGPVEESTVETLAVTGTLPAELSGRFLRNGPNPSGNVDLARHHWFIGDGMVHGIRIDSGRALWYRNRYVHGGANTHVIGHAGKTLAIVEAGGRPSQLGDELEPLGLYDFGGTLEGSFSAHPKLDPDTGELHVMTYRPGPPPFQLTYLVVSADSRIRHSVEIPIRGPAMAHDMSITANWIVIYDLPVLADPSLAQRGFRFPMTWQPDYGARVGLMPRDGGAGDIRWCDVPLGYVFHPMNAFENDAGAVVLDVCRYDRMFAGGYNSGPFSGDQELTLDRWTVNPSTRAVSVDRIDDRAQEFPRCHPDLNGKPYRYGYTVEVAGRSFPRLLKHDLAKGTARELVLGAGQSSSEAVFVPSAGGVDEDDGYLMAWIYDQGRDASEFVVVDAGEMTVLARVTLPVRVPYGFHGSWIADA